MKEGTLFTIKGKTDGSSATGDCPLDSELFYITGTSPYTNPTWIRIPLGMKAKLWTKRIGGEVATTFTINYTYDVTVSPPTAKEIDLEKLASAGEFEIEKRRPIVLESRTGKEAFKISWSQPTAGVAYIALEVELSEE